MRGRHDTGKKRQRGRQREYRSERKRREAVGNISEGGRMKQAAQIDNDRKIQQSSDTNNYMGAK